MYKGVLETLKHIPHTQWCNEYKECLVIQIQELEIKNKKQGRGLQKVYRAGTVDFVMAWHTVPTMEMRK